MANEFVARNGIIAKANSTITGTLDVSGNITMGTALVATRTWVTGTALAGYATQSYVTTAINNLIDAAPGTLDTLNELAAALGDDPNFVTTVTNSIATKLSLAGGTMTGNINWGTTDRGLTWSMNTDGAYIKFFNTGDGDTNSRLEYATSDNGNEFHRWMVSTAEEMTLKSDGLRVTDSIWMGGNLVATQSWVTSQNYLTSVPDEYLTETEGNALYAPISHTHSATDITSGTLASARLSGTYAISVSGSAATLTTARTLTIGSTGKTFNGSANVSWSLAEIGAAATSHTHAATDITSGVLADDRLNTTTARLVNFTNPVTIESDSDGILNLKQLGLGGTAGVKNAGWNYIQFLDSEGDRQGYFGIDSAGNFQFASEITGNVLIGGSRVYTVAYHPEADTWTTARTLTIGNTGKSVNGSANVSWTLAEIGALGATAKAADSELLDGIDSTGFVRQLSDGSSPDYQTPSSRRVNPNASNPTNEHYAVITYGNNGNVTGQLATHYQTGNLYSRGYNSSWSAWRRYWNDTDFTSTNVSNWNTAYGWGNHASAGYGLSTGDITAVGLTASILTLTRAAGNLTAAVPTFNQNTTGSAATLTTARTLTIGSTGKTFNGSANVSWSLAEIGAQAAGSYLTAETDTLATVTARGATTSTELTIQGGWASTILNGDNVVVRKPNYPSGGWARTLLNFQEYTTVSLYQIGAYGGGNTFIYGYLGVAYNDTMMRWYPNKNITIDGNVGIGTASPAYRLDVNGTIGFAYSGSNANYIEQANGAFGYGRIRPFNTSGLFAFDTNYTLGGGYDFAYNGSSVIRVTSTGNVGIGTTSPTAPLHTYTAAAVPILAERSTSNANVAIQFKDQTSSWYAGKASNGYFAIGGEANLGNVTIFNITTGGNVGIGTNSPATKLDVNGVITATGGNSTNWNTAFGWGNHAGLYLGISDTAADSNKLGGIAAASYALLASPALTGTPTAPTAATATNNTQIATTAFVKNQGYLTTESDTLATVTGRGASTSTAVTFNGNVTLGNAADLRFVDLAGTFPTSGKGFDWTLNNDGARIYAIQPSSDSIDLVFQLRDNATPNDRFVFWVDDYQGAAFDKYPLVIRGGTEFDLVDSGLFVRGTQVLTNARNLQNVSGNISMFTNDSGYITSSASITGNAATATTLATARTLTIGNTGKSFNGSANVSWSLAEIGALSLSAPSTLDVNAANGTGLFVGTTNLWTNRGPSVNNAGSLFSINTHPGNFYSQLWFNTGGDAVYHRTANNVLPTAAWQRFYLDNYHPEADRWTTARTITIGNTSKSVDGSANVSWSLAEIGAQAAGSYLTAEADTLATVTARGASTSTQTTFSGNVILSKSSGNNILHITSVSGGVPVIYMTSPNRGWGQYVDVSDLHFKDETGNIVTMVLKAGGNVGIGTTAPSRKLHVVSGDWDNVTGGGVIFENSNTVGASLTLKPSASVVTNGTNGWSVYAGGPGAAISDGNLGFWAHGTNDARMVIQRGGNVGIGNNNPSYKLDVSGNARITSTLDVTGNIATAGNISANGYIGSNTSQTRDKLRVWSSGAYAIGMKSGYTFGPLQNDYAMSFQMNNQNERGFWWGDDGHTDAQGAMALSTRGFLTVAEKIRVGYGQSDTADTPTGALDVSGDAVISGNVGIGTLTPNSKLDVRRTSSGIAAEFISTAGTLDEYVDLKLISGNAASGAYGTILRHQRIGSSGADFAILTNPTLTGTPVERMRITKDGSVGISTTSPVAKLQVVSTADGSDVFAVDGVNGRLFTVTDDLSDSLFSVNTIAGLPVIEAFADNTVKIGPFGNPVIIDSSGNLSIGGAEAATKAYVDTSISNLIGGAPGALDTLNELAAAINDDASYASTITSALATKAPLASPALTGTPTAPTAATATNNTQIATTAFVKAQGYLTSYSETDTLATVTGRGATTSTALTLNGNVSVGTSAKLSFGSQVRQMIDLWSTSYGIGVQSNTQYFRTGSGFAWFRGGVHSDTANDAGSGGVVAMRMDGSSNLTVTGNISAANFSGTSSGTNTGDQTTISGNAGSATVLQTARTLTIGSTGKSFNGSANVAWSLAEIGAYAATNPSGFITASSLTPYWNYTEVTNIDVQNALVTFIGDVTINGTLTETSSIRFKENIKPLESALGKVEQLNPVSYNKVGSEQEEIGLIAEEVVELFPEVVTYNEDGQPSGIQYQRLSVILLKAVQELTERVNKLENK